MGFIWLLLAEDMCVSRDPLVLRLVLAHSLSWDCRTTNINCLKLTALIVMCECMHMQINTWIALR